jgi:hypothetical protein
MYIHIHVHISSAWNHVGDVEKNGYPTSKQAKNQAANQKQRRPHKQTCGRLGQFTSTKRKNTNNPKAIRSTDKARGVIGKSSRKTLFIGDRMSIESKRHGDLL